MCCLKQAGKFIGGDEGDILSPASMDDNHFAVFSDFIAKGSKICACLGIGGLDSHKWRLRLICTGILYIFDRNLQESNTMQLTFGLYCSVLLLIALMATFKGKPAAEEASKDLIANPEDEDNRAAFRKELRKILEAEPTLAVELARLLEKAQRESSESIIVTGSGAAATKDSVAAGAGGVAVRGDVNGGITLGGSEKKE
jgi:hypothetical protein